jgi:sulfur carrier protein ThiS adenylyltransferase
MSANTYLTPEERAVLESARVGIAGAGGLGSNCAMHLVRAGIQHLTVVDFDVVNESNLNRQFFFRDQLGQKKVEALKENLLRIDPDADIRAVDMRLDASSAREVFADCDIVVEAFDVVDAKVMLVSSFASSGKKLVTASGLAGWGRSNAMRVRKMGNIVAIGDGETAVGENAAPASPRVGIAAAMQANSVVAILLGKEL